MRIQRNMSQIKEQNKSPENELNEMDANNLPDTEFKTLVIGCSINRGGVEELSENFNK